MGGEDSGDEPRTTCAVGLSAAQPGFSLHPRSLGSAVGRGVGPPAFDRRFLVRRPMHAHALLSSDSRALLLRLSLPDQVDRAVSLELTGDVLQLSATGRVGCWRGVRDQRRGPGVGLWRPPWGGCRLACVVESAAQRDGPQPGEGCLELAGPGPTRGQVQLSWSAAVGEPPGECEQPAAESLGDDGPGVTGAEEVDPALQVVGDGGEHGPGAIGAEARGGAVGEPGAVFEVADGKFDLGVSAVVGVEGDGGAGPVGGEGADVASWRTALPGRPGSGCGALRDGARRRRRTQRPLPPSPDAPTLAQSPDPQHVGCSNHHRRATRWIEAQSTDSVW